MEVLSLSVSAVFGNPDMPSILSILLIWEVYSAVNVGLKNGKLFQLP